MIPDVTLTTACYDISKYHAGARNLETNIKTMEALLEVECYLYIFGDSTTIPLIKEIRNDRFGLGHLTHYVISDIESMWTYEYADRIRANREAYHPLKTSRDSMESHMIQCNKIDFVLQAIRINPFRTGKFGWIDGNIGINGAKISQKYNKNLLPNILHNVTDKFHIQVLNVVDKTFLHPNRIREYYGQYRWVVCGCLFTMSPHIGVPILNRLKELFIETTMRGYGHAEEMLFLGVLDEFYDSIERSYGDYYNILNNFTRQTLGSKYILENILERYMYYGYHREGYDCCRKLVADFDVSDANHSLRFLIHFKYYMFALYYRKKKAAGILRVIKQHIADGTYTEEFSKNKLTYLEKFNMCLHVPKSRCMTRRVRAKTNIVISEDEETDISMIS